MAIAAIVPQLLLQNEDSPLDAFPWEPRLNLIEGWWRIFRRKAFAGQSLADDHDIEFVTRIATLHLNRHAQPWVWGRPPKPHRVLRRRFVYCL